MLPSRIRSMTISSAVSICVHLAAFSAVRGSANRLRSVEATPGMAGDTFDVEVASAMDSQTEPSAPGASNNPVGESDLVSSSHRQPAPRKTSGAANERLLFGAVGQRFAADLAATFTRAIPQVFSADPAWSDTELGATASADVTLVLDEAGHIESSRVSGRPSSALRSSIARTLAVLAERPLIARERTTRLRLIARATSDEIHDGLHGDVFALSGGSFAGEAGVAFFALPAKSGPGRRIDVEVRVLH